MVVPITPSVHILRTSRSARTKEIKYLTGGLLVLESQ